MKAVKQFATWMLKDGRVTSNPLKHLSISGKVETENPRRALTKDEITFLFPFVETSKPIFNIPGPERALIYRVAVETA